MSKIKLEFVKTRTAYVPAQKIKQIFFILLGSLIYSVSVNLFVVPNHFLSGGAAGISLLLQYVTGISSGYFTILINIPIFCFGIKIIDKEFGILSLIGMLSMSIFLILTKDLANIISMTDLLIPAICSGALCGLGMAIIILNRASEGGTDIVAIILKKKYGINLSSMTFILNAVIVFIGLLLNDLTITIYTLISLFIRAYILEKALSAVNEKKLIMVISNRYDDIKKSFLLKLDRGVTFLHGEGAFTGDSKEVIYSIMSAGQIEEAKRIIEAIDGKAIVSVMNVDEVHGKGFRSLSF